MPRRKSSKGGIDPVGQPRGPDGRFLPYSAREMETTRLLQEYKQKIENLLEESQRMVEVHQILLDKCEILEWRQDLLEKELDELRRNMELQKNGGV